MPLGAKPRSSRLHSHHPSSSDAVLQGLCKKFAAVKMNEEKFEGFEHESLLIIAAHHEKEKLYGKRAHRLRRTAKERRQQRLPGLDRYTGYESKPRIRSKLYITQNVADIHAHLDKGGKYFDRYLHGKATSKSRSFDSSPPRSPLFHHTIKRLFYRTIDPPQSQHFERALRRVTVHARASKTGAGTCIDRTAVRAFAMELEREFLPGAGSALGGRIVLMMMHYMDGDSFKELIKGVRDRAEESAFLMRKAEQGRLKFY